MDRPEAARTIKNHVVSEVGKALAELRSGIKGRGDAETVRQHLKERVGAQLKHYRDGLS